ncbi:MAG: DUF2752 domain-containing protein [Actinobacteria bacterium]|nr:DUF2752 domain-containing protein [Actinomycetota bacterium]
MIAAPGHRIRFDDSDVRTASAVLLGLAAARAAIPGEPGLPCPLRALTGVPCPLCGMTTSVTSSVELDLAGALTANPGGVVLVILAVAILLGPARRLVVPASVVYFALAASWVWELQRFSIL